MKQRMQGLSTALGTYQGRGNVHHLVCSLKEAIIRELPCCRRGGRVSETPRLHPPSCHGWLIFHSHEKTEAMFSSIVSQHIEALNQLLTA